MSFKLTDFLKMIFSEPNKIEEAGDVYEFKLPITYLNSIGECHCKPVENKPTLFFDIDGVLHPGDSGTLEHAGLLEKLCDDIDDLQLVMSSNWRETIDLEYFYRVFPGKIIARTVGFTPVIPVKKFKRQREIEAFANHFKISRYICIDDQERLFEPGWGHLLLINRSYGLDLNAVNKVKSCFSMQLL